MSQGAVSEQTLKTIEIVTAENPDAAVIWLHGLGASGNDFVPVIPELKLPEEYRIRFIFPFAPEMPVTVNGGMVMPAWYDILDMSIDRKVDRVQLERSAQMVDQLIDQQVATGIPSSRIILAGFSQGGAVAYQLALSSKRQLAGVMALSTYFATSETLEFSEESQGLPIMVMHGTYDPVVPGALAQQAVQILEGRGYQPEYKTYPMDHSVCLEEIQDISAWLQKVLGGG